MRKVGSILFVTVICCSCSVIRKDLGSMTGRNDSSEAGLNLLERVRMHNITNSDFYISRADVAIEKNGITMSGFANIKFRSPDKYMISIRTIGGIEAIRIFVSKDTLMINDRLNRKFMFGKPGYLKKMYGLDVSFLPVIFGDIYVGKRHNPYSDDCRNGLSESTFKDGISRTVFKLDCEKEKIVASTIESGSMMPSFMLEYDDFERSGIGLFPKTIFMEQKGGEIKISVKIKNIEIPWEGEMDFIPGNKYEKVELL